MVTTIWMMTSMLKGGRRRRRGGGGEEQELEQEQESQQERVHEEDKEDEDEDVRYVETFRDYTSQAEVLRLKLLCQRFPSKSTTLKLQS